MNRTAIQTLEAWKNAPGRKPLIIRGARQVGKTWLMQEFGRTHYERVAYVNLDGNTRLQRLFETDLHPARIVEALQLECGCKIEPRNTLVIFDEVQEVPRALTSLKYFCEETPDYHIVAAGSLLGVALHPGTSFPVGKVDFLDLHPLTFEEFLCAIGKAEHLDLLRKQDWPTIAAFKDQFLAMLRQYFLIGGMPEVVAAFAAHADYAEARLIQNRILAAYEQDFSKHAPNATVPRIRLLWQSIPAQLARENRKFVYGAVKSGARAREYELALAWLSDCGLVCKVNRISKPGLPAAAYEDFGAFKLFLLDVGLLAALSGLDSQAILDGDRIFTEFKGSLTEQYLLQQLRSRPDTSVYYWSSDVGTAEVDFVVQTAGRMVPIEVKAGENLQAKSLKVYREKFAPKMCFRLSLSDHRQESWIRNIPLYAIPAITF